MKKNIILTLIFTFISLNVFSQIIEEKKEGDFILKNHLNNDLEIIKIEKFKENSLYESIEYLPGGKIKNGKFYHKIYGFGNYVNGRLESGEILYIEIVSYYTTESWYIDNKNQIFVAENKISTSYANNNQPVIVYENKNNQRIPLKNYDDNKIVNNLSKCHYAKLKISNFRLKGMQQIKVGYFSEKTETLYEINDGSDDLVSVMNFNENGILHGEQLYFANLKSDDNDSDIKKIVHTAIYKNGTPQLYSKNVLPNNETEKIVYIDSITFQKDDLINSTFLYNKTIVNHPKPTLVFNPFSGFVKLINHYYKINDEEQSFRGRKTFITNDLKKIIYKRASVKLDYDSNINDEDFFNASSYSARDTKPDDESNVRKITFNGKPKIFYISEQNMIERIIKNDYKFIPYSFSSKNLEFSNPSEIASIEMLYLYQLFLTGSVAINETYFTLNQNTFEFENFDAYNRVMDLKKDIENGVIYDKVEQIKMEENYNSNEAQENLNSLLTNKAEQIKQSTEVENKKDINVKQDLSLAFNKIKNKWEYFMDKFVPKETYILNSMDEICDDERCIRFLLTTNYLIATYKINDVVEFDTQIIDLKTNSDLVINSKEKIFVESFDKDKNILKISSEGYDKIGRYFQTGIFDLKDGNVKLEKKER